MIHLRSWENGSHWRWVSHSLPPDLICRPFSALDATPALSTSAPRRLHPLPVGSRVGNAVLVCVVLGSRCQVYVVYSGRESHSALHAVILPYCTLYSNRRVRQLLFCFRLVFVCVYLGRGLGCLIQGRLFRPGIPVLLVSGTLLYCLPTIVQIEETINCFLF